MKAKITRTDSQFIVSLEPETDAEKAQIREFGLVLTRSHMINCRGFAYMQEAVEFLVQPMPRGD